MQKIKGLKEPRKYLIPFKPLCSGNFSFTNMNRHGLPLYPKELPPFIDGSCFREPDFENEHPAITGLCRTNRFVPMLEEGDLVIYFTKKDNYFKNKYGYWQTWYKDTNVKRHWRFVAILKVINKFPNHNKAEEHYNDEKWKIPNDILTLTSGSQPFSLEKTHHDENNLDDWEKFYRSRANDDSQQPNPIPGNRGYPKVAVTNPYCKPELFNPRIITENQLKYFFKEKVRIIRKEKGKKDKIIIGLPRHPLDVTDYFEKFNNEFVVK